jgi:two-component system nitrate/nitrite response regulator NarL
MVSVTSVGESSRRIRVFIRDTNRMGTQLLADVLGRDRRFDVLPEARTIEEIGQLRPDVVLIALNATCGALSGSGLVQELRRREPQLRIIVVVEESSREIVTEALRAGARGVFCRTEPIKSLAKCIVSVFNGQVWANQKQIEFVLQALANPLPIRLVDARGAALLSSREQDVVRWVAEGLTNREIAAQLDLSEHTVKNYLFRIFDKLGISNRMELILYVVSQLASGNNRGVLAAPTDPREASTPARALAVAQSYLRGEGVPLDAVAAHMWFEIAEAGAGEVARQAAAALRDLRRSMTPDQMAEAGRRAAEWLSQAQLPPAVAHREPPHPALSARPSPKISVA